MAESSYSFRTALSGFHKGDVIGYIEKSATEHRSELLQKDQIIQNLQDEIYSLRQQLTLLMMETPVPTTAPATTPEPVSAPEPEPISVPVPEPVVAPEPKPISDPQSSELVSMELQAYRRAEAVERNANTRARKVYQQLEDVCGNTLDGFQLTDAAVKQAIEVMMSQASSLEQAYQALSAALNASREKLSAIKDVTLDLD